MAIPVTCTCGKSYRLKDEFAGKRIRCTVCQAVLAVPEAAAVTAVPAASDARPGPSPSSSAAGAAAAAASDGIDPAFARDRFLLHQKHLAINEKYHVWSEAGEKLLFVERPSFLLRQLAAILAGIAAAAVVVGIAFGMLASILPSEEIKVAVWLATFLAAIVTLIVVATAVAPKRHVCFYRDESRGEKLLEVLQDAKFQVVNATYTLQDHRGQVLARLAKNQLLHFVRKRWVVTDPSGKTVLIVKEDSILLSLLRRVIGPLFGLLRTNFVFLEPGSERRLGEFNRKLTLLDKYALDLSADPEGRIDRRTALAMGVLLDTGERR